MLYIFGGLPGTGKTTLSRCLAQDKKAVYLRIDTLEQAMRESGLVLSGPEGYIAAYRLTTDNLCLGCNVVVDSVNPLALTRNAWRQVAMGCQAPFMEIEVVCSNIEEHRHRIESRTSDIQGLQLPNWDDVLQREYEHWDCPHIVIDTAGQSSEKSYAELLQSLSVETF